MRKAWVIGAASVALALGVASMGSRAPESSAPLAVSSASPGSDRAVRNAVAERAAESVAEPAAGEWVGALNAPQDAADVFVGDDGGADPASRPGRTRRVFDVLYEPALEASFQRTAGILDDLVEEGRLGADAADDVEILLQDEAAETLDLIERVRAGDVAEGAGNRTWAEIQDATDEKLAEVLPEDAIDELRDRLASR